MVLLLKQKLVNLECYVPKLVKLTPLNSLMDMSINQRHKVKLSVTYFQKEILLLTLVMYLYKMKMPIFIFKTELVTHLGTYLQRSLCTSTG